MLKLVVHLDGDNCWPDLKDKVGTPDYIFTKIVSIARLPAGMQSGLSSVSVRIDLPDGKVVVAETSLALLRNAVLAFEEADKGRAG